MINRGTFTQIASSAVWVVDFQAEWSKGRPLAAYDADGNSLEIDSWVFEDNKLKVNFGIDPVLGSLEYEYQLEGESNVVVDSVGNQATITINQYGGGASTDTFR